MKATAQPARHGKAGRARHAPGGEARIAASPPSRGRCRRADSAWTWCHRSHTASQDLPRAVAILNPHQPGCKFPGASGGVGVAFHLFARLGKSSESGWFNAHGRAHLREQLDLVALGPSPTWVPLTGPNRILVHFGLKSWRARAAACWR